MRFHYVAYAASGEQVNGWLEADSEQFAEESLWGSNLVVVRLAPERVGLRLEDQLPSIFGVKRADVIVFTRQLSNLVRSGVGLVRGIQLLGQEAPKPAMGRLLGDILAALHTGSFFSQAVSRRPDVFPELYQRLVAVGESTGEMAPVLDQLAEYMEREQAAREAVLKALGYPAFLLLMTGGVAALLITQVLPSMMPLFREYGAELPLITRVVIAITDFFTNYGLVVAAAAVAIPLLAWLWTRTPAGREGIARLLLHLPAFGPVLARVAVARTTRTMGLLIRAGLPITEVVDLLVNMTGNPVYREALERVRDGMLAGRRLSALFEETGVFPALMTQLVAIGEEAGTLEQNLGILTVFYEAEANRSISSLVALLEPATIIFVGLMVGGVAAAIVAPLYGVLQSIR